jgi:gluconate 2-dehydrogenase gamma chain
MENPGPTRRDFIRSAGGVLGVTWVAAHGPAIAAAHAHALAAIADGRSGAFKFFSPEDARDVDAIVAHIIPSDDVPGAREAGAIYFIDRSLSTWLAPRAQGFRSGLHDFQTRFQAAHPPGGFAQASDEAQLAFLESVEASEFFQTTRTLTLIGMFALPAYGGNRDGIGWRLIGFEDQHVFAPPFGFYDRDYPGFMPPEAKP